MHSGFVRAGDKWYTSTQYIIKCYSFGPSTHNPTRWVVALTTALPRNTPKKVCDNVGPTRNHAQVVKPVSVAE